MNNQRAAITQIIRELHIPANIQGYNMVRDAVSMRLEDADALRRITTKLYANIAKEHGTTPSRVERAIRYAVEAAYCAQDHAAFDKLFGHRTERPSVSEFIAMLVDEIREFRLAGVES